MSKPLLSVVIPVYNRPLLAEQALLSVLSQGLDRCEIIFVDDGSTPAFTGKDGETAGARVRSERHPHNRGAAAARNTGAAAAQGEWLAFLDSDDVFLDVTLAPRLAAAQAFHRAGGDPLTVHVAGFVQKSIRSGKSAFRVPVESCDPADFAGGCWFAPGSTSLMRREVYAQIGPADEALGRLEDLDWYLRLALRGGGVQVWPHAAAQINVGGKPRFSTLDAACNRLLQKYASLPPALLKRLNAYCDVERASVMAGQGRWIRMAGYLARSLRTYPRPRLHLKKYWRVESMPAQGVAPPTL